MFPWARTTKRLRAWKGRWKSATVLHGGFGRTRSLSHFGLTRVSEAPSKSSFRPEARRGGLYRILHNSRPLRPPPTSIPVFPLTLAPPPSNASYFSFKRVSRPADETRRYGKRTEESLGSHEDSREVSMSSRSRVPPKASLQKTR